MGNGSVWSGSPSLARRTTPSPRAASPCPFWSCGCVALGITNPPARPAKAKAEGEVLFPGPLIQFGMMKLLLCVIWSLILLGWQDNTNAALNADNTGAPPIQDEPASEPVSDSTAAATSGAKQEQERAVDPDATDDQANTPSALPPSPAGAGAGAGAASKTSGQSDAAGEDEEEEDLGLTWTWIFTIIAMSFVSNKMLALVSGKSQQTILYRAAENLRRHGRLVLVLDLDETLVHCEVSPIESYDMRE